MKHALTVDLVLGPGGALEGALAGYEHRPEQLKVARAVAQAFHERSYLMAEAGTGTGKTLAYLVPAILSGKKVVISTATKTLQEQIFWRDFPLLRNRIGLECDAAYLKGRANYLCLHRFEQFDLRPEFPSPEEAKLWPTLRSWAIETTTGDRAELDLPEHFGTWSQVSSTSDNCLGPRCPVYESCHLTKARRRAESAELVIVNHHLFFADLALRKAEQGVEGVLPAYDALIFDEAHALEEIAVQHFGRQVSSTRLAELCKDALESAGAAAGQTTELPALAQRLRTDASRLFMAMGRAFKINGAGTVPLDEASWEAVDAETEGVLETLGAIASATSGSEEPASASISRRSRELCADLEFLRKAERPDHVYWAEERARSFIVRASPIDVGQEMQKRLYPHVNTVVFTSATLTAGDDFAFFSQRMGLTGENPSGAVPRRRLVVPSPFDFPSQAALYLPSDMPEPADPRFSEAVAEQLLALCALTKGRAFALFTSLRNMHAVHKLCLHRLDVPALLQGEAPKSVLLEQFRAQPSVLFAAHSFWEGVDVPGEALSLVVIDKLPFSSPNDPLVAARIAQLRREGEDPFSSYQLPEATVALRQGFGRLIRTRTDRGIVALLDSRLTSRAYGRRLLKSLPPARSFQRLEALSTWFLTTTARET